MHMILMAINSGTSVNHGETKILQKLRFKQFLRYNGMRPNGFPENHYHGGKGTESVCHFCCNPTSSDGMFCNRHMLDYTADAKIAQDSSSHSYGLEFANGKGTNNKYPSGVGHLEWMKYDENNSASDGKVKQKVLIHLGCPRD